ncbi:hypothetical protein NKH18_32380 [Streptomyces sp. M10(2022)]
MVARQETWVADEGGAVAGMMVPADGSGNEEREPDIRCVWKAYTTADDQP